MAPKVLIVLTSHDKIDKLGKPTGWFLPELAHPYEVLAPKTTLTFASPTGGAAPLDPASVEMSAQDEVSQTFLKEQKDLWENTLPLASFLGKSGDFDAIFFPGGHGPMYDLAIDETSQKLIAEFWDAGKPVASVCHGPAALVNVKTSSGGYLIDGKKVTGFSNAEEDQMQLSEAMPFLLETAMKQRGATYLKADEAWGEKVVVDGKLITGQNPASAKAVGEAIVKALGV